MTVKVRADRSVQNHCCYLAVGVTRDALGIWWGDCLTQRRQSQSPRAALTPLAGLGAPLPARAIRQARQDGHRSTRRDCRRHRARRLKRPRRSSQHPNPTHHPPRVAFHSPRALIAPAMLSLADFSHHTPARDTTHGNVRRLVRDDPTVPEASQLSGLRPREAVHIIRTVADKDGAVPCAGRSSPEYRGSHSGSGWTDITGMSTFVPILLQPCLISESGFPDRLDPR